MRLIFFGSDSFAVAPLSSLVSSGYEVCLVVTQPDKKKGRGMHVLPTAVKEAAMGLKLKVIEPFDINSQESIAYLKGLSPDLFVVIAYGQKLSQAVLSVPKIMSLNVHASLLPKYRGAAPINWAIIKGETSTGNSLMKISSEMDAGDVLLQSRIDILESDTAVTLAEKLSKDATFLLADGLKRIKEGRYELRQQDNTQASFAPKLKKSDGLIDWRKPASEIYNLVRGCLEWPGAFTYYKGKILKVFSDRVIKKEDCPGFGSPGEIIDTSGKILLVAAGKDCLGIDEIQLEGKNRMSADEFMRGSRITPGEKLGKN